MSLFGMRHRLQEANVDNSGGNNNQQQQQQQQPAEWLKPFGEHAKVFDGIKDPAELATKWTAANTELTTLKAKPSAFDWRKELGGEDEKAQKFLGRFNDPGSFMKTALEAHGKLSERDAHKPLAADAKPEEVKAWREANGIPLEPKGYFEKLPDGLVIGKEDQAAFDRYGAIWHQFNLPPAAAHAMAKAYYEDQQNVASEEAKVDRADQQKATQELRTLWGNDYSPNMQILNSFLDGMPADVKDLFKDGTLADGTRFMNNPALVAFFAEAARQINPAAHLIPAGSEGLKSLDTELNSMKALMADKNSKYWKGPESETMQKRYRELVTALQSLKK
jgi:hypothetical protein